ncbi:MAG: hypothetical protein KDK54_21030 [Leptospiraceae bacterium]|nr:hypothetical protein [Leptospiraceae bacterium]
MNPEYIKKTYKLSGNDFDQIEFAFLQIGLSISFNTSTQHVNNRFLELEKDLNFKLGRHTIEYLKEIKMIDSYRLICITSLEREGFIQDYINYRRRVPWYFLLWNGLWGMLKKTISLFKVLFLIFIPNERQSDFYQEKSKSKKVVKNIPNFIMLMIALLFIGFILFQWIERPIKIEDTIPKDEVGYISKTYSIAKDEEGERELLAIPFGTKVTYRKLFQKNGRDVYHIPKINAYLFERDFMSETREAFRTDIMTLKEYIKNRYMIEEKLDSKTVSRQIHLFSGQFSIVDSKGLEEHKGEYEILENTIHLISGNGELWLKYIHGGTFIVEKSSLLSMLEPYSYQSKIRIAFPKLESIRESSLVENKQLREKRRYGKKPKS